MVKSLSCLVALALSTQMAWAQEERRVEPVVVTATRIAQPLSLVSESVTVITEEEIARSQAKTVADLLRQVPGLDIQRSGSLGKFTSVRIRGAESDQTLVMLDGVQINNPFDQLANLADLTTDNIERIEIVRGGESALYGSEAVGGVINIITKKGKGRPTPGLTLEAGSLNSFREQVSLAGASKWRWPLDYSLTLSRLDTRGQSRRDGYEDSSLSSRLGADFGKWGEASVILRAMSTENEIPFDFVFDPFTILPGFPFGITRELKDTNFSQQDSSFLVTGIYKVKPFSWWNIRLQASGQDIKRKADNPFDPILAPNFLKSRLNAGKLTGEMQNDFYISDFLTLTLGYEFKHDRARFTSLDNFATNFGFGLALPSFSKTGVKIIEDNGAYLQAHMEFLERLFITLGVRFDRFSTFGDTTNFKAAFSYLINKTATKLKFNWGTQFNAPTIVDLFFPVFGNPLLGPERSQSFEAGLEQEFLKGKVKLEAVYFHIAFKDRIEFVPDPTSFVPPFGALRNVGRGKSQGVEFIATYSPWDFLRLALNWSFLDTEDLATRKEFARRPRNKLNFTARYDPWERLHLDVAFLALGSQRDEFKFIDARGRLRATSRNHGYNRLDLTPAYDLLLEKDRHRIFQKLTIFARVENALDKDYEEVKGFPAPGLFVWGGIKATF